MNPASCSFVTMARRASPHVPSLLLAALLGAASVAGCRSAPSAQLHVLGIEHSPNPQGPVADQIFVQVVNTAKKTMRLQRLQYTFAGAGAGADPGRGELALAREVAPGSSVIVAIPIDLASLPDGEVGAVTLNGRLFAELDRIVQQIPVSIVVR